MIENKTQLDAHAIMDSLEEFAKTNRPLNWEEWMRGAGKLNALLQTEDEKLALLEHTFIKIKAVYIEEGKPAAQAKLLAEQGEEYLELMKQRAFVKRCEETIRIAKKMATLSKETHNLM